MTEPASKRPLPTPSMVPPARRDEELVFNTRLTEPMLDEVFARAKALADLA